ncbi:MAG: LPS-assembly protein LptD [Candidatus Xiphinematobacter sp.]|nr:MAG: LPS-assembly protein LptD [Candidatus Xiphinematobacter sp.]
MKKHTETVTIVTLAILLLLPTYFFRLDNLGASSSSVEITAEKAASFEEGIFTAEGHVQVHHKGIYVYCDHAEYRPRTKDILLLGNVRIHSPDISAIGQHVLYNMQSEHAHTLECSMVHYPILLRARSACILPRAFRAQQVVLTTDDQSEPGYHIRAKAVYIYKNKNARMVCLFPTFYVGRMPIFWIPYFSIGPNDTGLKVIPGYNSEWGAFVLATYSFAYEGLDGSRLGRIHIDRRAHHGMAFGFDAVVGATKNEGSHGNCIAYWTSSNKPLARNGIPALGNTDYRHRYRLSYSQNIFFSGNTYAICDLNALSDCNIMRDFYPAESQNPKLGNHISLTKRGQNYTINLLNCFQINDFQNIVERLPELALDVKQHPILGGPLYLEGTWTLGQLRRPLVGESWSGASGKQLLGFWANKKRNLHFAARLANRPVCRLGGFIKISMPKTHFGWITIVPYAGVHATLYKRLSGSFKELTGMGTADQGTCKVFTNRRGIFRRGSIAPNAQRHNAATWYSALHEKENNLCNPMRSRSGIAFHPGANCGLESSFKISRVYRLQSQLLGLDDLMHVVQPYVSYSVVQNLRSKPGLFYQFDTVQQTTQRIPISFPDFQAVDAIDSWNVFRTGVRNSLVTRRNSGNYRWLTMDTFFDYNLRNPYSLARVGSFSSLVTYCPSRWLTVSCDIQAPLDREGFAQFDLNFSLMPARGLQFAIGYYYLNDYPTRQASGIHAPSPGNMNQMALDAYFRLNENWAMSSQEQFDANRRLLSYQRYFIHRDLSSWIASFGMDIRNQNQKLRTGLVLVMTLKAAPHVVIPPGLDPLRKPLLPTKGDL